jgi:hypothetical protein
MWRLDVFPLRFMRLMIRVVKDLRTGMGVAAESRITLAGAITKDLASRHAGGTMNQTEKSPGGVRLVRAQTYEITFLGQAGNTLRAEFDDCQVTVGPGTTTIRAELPDRGALSGLMERINSLGLDVINVNLVAPPVQQLPAQVTHPGVMMRAPEQALRRGDRCSTGLPSRRQLPPLPTVGRAAVPALGSPFSDHPAVGEHTSPPTGDAEPRMNCT